MSVHIPWIVVLLLCLSATACSAGNVGMQLVQIMRPHQKPLQGAMWYPTPDRPSLHHIVNVDINVALNGRVVGDGLPLIVVSHGDLGALDSHAELAIALVQAGFIVASVSHDEYGPHFMLKLPDRPVQLQALTDYAVSQWKGRSHIDVTRIGAFGFSLGGLTVLVDIGGKPDTGAIAPFCKTVKSDFSCVMERQHKLDLVEHPPAPSAWVADPRIKAAVIAAPALGFTFGTSGLAGVTVPVQLWAAGQDKIVPTRWNADAVRQDLPHASDYHLVPQANHGDFSGSCPVAGKLQAPPCQNPSGFDLRKFRADFAAAVVGFFQRILGVRRANG